MKLTINTIDFTLLFTSDPFSFNRVLLPKKARHQKPCEVPFARFFSFSLP
jgi:hypothetical protein